MFSVMSDADFASNADDNKTYVAVDSMESVVRKLENNSIKLFKECSDNQIKINVTSLFVTMNTSQ